MLTLTSPMLTLTSPMLTLTNRLRTFRKLLKKTKFININLKNKKLHI
jgi:hypothetical protein